MVSQLLPRGTFLTCDALDAAGGEEVSRRQLQVQVLPLIMTILYIQLPILPIIPQSYPTCPILMERPSLHAQFIVDIAVLRVPFTFSLLLLPHRLAGMRDAVFLPPAFPPLAIGGVHRIFFGDIVEVLLDDGEGVGGVSRFRLGVLRGYVLVGEDLEFHLLIIGATAKQTEHHDACCCQQTDHDQYDDYHQLSVLQQEPRREGGGGQRHI